MATRTKTFDCVGMKNRIQAQLIDEFEKRTGESSSFAEFLTRRNERDEWVQKARAKLGRRSH